MNQYNSVYNNNNKLILYSNNIVTLITIIMIPLSSKKKNYIKIFKQSSIFFFNETKICHKFGTRMAYTSFIYIYIYIYIFSIYIPLLIISFKP